MFQRNLNSSCEVEKMAGKAKLFLKSTQVSTFDPCFTTALRMPCPLKIELYELKKGTVMLNLHV